MNIRFKLFRTVIACITAIAIVFPLMSYAYFPGVDETADKIKEELVVADQYNNSIEGDIIDANGEAICFATEPGISGVVNFESYFSLVGYNTNMLGCSGLRSTFYNELKKETGKDNKGSTLKLTTINELQCAAYDVIKGQDASVVILDNKTGRILALASSNSGYELDVNAISAKTIEKANEHEGSLVPNWKTVLAPGSVIKAAFSVPIIEHNWHKETLCTGGTIKVGNTTFSNFNGVEYTNIDLEQALGYSVNTYFIHYAQKLGSYGIRNTCERFLIGNDIELDFTTIKSSHGLNDTSVANFAATSFGQGKVLVSSIHLAMIASSIANGGTMLKPYIIDSIVSDNRVTYSGSTEKLTQVADKDTMKTLMKTLQKSAVEFYDIPESYGIGAKTGTAQLGHSIVTGTGTDRATFLSCSKDYTVVISANYTNKFGGDFKDSALYLYDILENLGRNNSLGG